MLRLCSCHFSLLAQKIFNPWHLHTSFKYHKYVRLNMSLNFYDHVRSLCNSFINTFKSLESANFRVNDLIFPHGCEIRINIKKLVALVGKETICSDIRKSTLKIMEVFIYVHCIAASFIILDNLERQLPDRCAEKQRLSRKITLYRSHISRNYFEPIDILLRQLDISDSWFETFRESFPY